MTRKEMKTPPKDKPDSVAFFEIDTRVEIWGTNSTSESKVRAEIQFILIIILPSRSHPLFCKLHLIGPALIASESGNRSI
jgi:hypothetical protein